MLKRKNTFHNIHYYFHRHFIRVECCTRVREHVQCTMNVLEFFVTHAIKRTTTKDFACTRNVENTNSQSCSHSYRDVSPSVTDVLGGIVVGLPTVLRSRISSGTPPPPPQSTRRTSLRVFSFYFDFRVNANRTVNGNPLVAP
jgi:hypothetical protein